MKILVLDTETSSLAPNTGQIIEIAATLINLDPVTAELEIIDEFSSLVKARYDIPEKIIRLTKIELQDLISAENYLEVQEKWADWLEKNQATEVPILGHSIDFDISFLQNEGWMLPSGKQIDTLDICKLLLPNCQAVNLEFLINFLEIDKLFSNRPIFNEENKQNTEIKSHRALYDARATAYLAQYLLKKSHEYAFCEEIIDLIKAYFLPDFSAYSKNFNWESFKDLKLAATEKIHIDVLGEIRGKSVDLIIKQACENNAEDLWKICQEDLRFCLKNNLKTEAFLLGKIMMYISQLPSNIYLKIHIYGENETNILEILLERFLENVEKISQKNSEINGNSKICVLINPEQCISRMDYICQEHLNLGQYISLLEVGLSLKIFDDKDAENIQKISTCYTFFLFVMRPCWQYSQFFYNPAFFKQKHYGLQEKFKDLLSEFKNIQEINFDEISQNNLVKIQKDYLKIISKKTKYFVDFELKTEGKYNLKLQGNNVIFAQPKKEFNLQNHFDFIVEKYNITELESFLSLQNLEAFLKIAGVILPKNIKQIKTHQEPSMVQEDLGNEEDILDEMQRQIVKNKKHIFTFIGQQNTLKQWQVLVKKEYSQLPSLIIGEDGGLTKIISKLESKGPCLVVLKSVDSSFILKSILPDKTQEIWLIAEPYLRLSNWWKNVSQSSNDPETFVRHLKHLNTASFCGKIHQKTGFKVHFVKDYFNS